MVQPALKAFCVDCHNDEEAERASWTWRGSKPKSAVLAERKVWRRVWEMLHNREMPPPEEEQPGEAQRLALTDWIEQMLARPAAGGAPNPGHVRPRRLTAAQYNATMAELFGLQRRTAFYDPQRKMAAGCRRWSASSCTGSFRSRSCICRPIRRRTASIRSRKR